MPTADSKFPPIRRHSSNISKSHHPQIKSVLFASNHLTIQSCISNSTHPLSSNSSSDINYITKINNNMPSRSASRAIFLTTHPAQQISNPLVKIQLAPQVSVLIRQAVPAPQVSNQTCRTIPASQVNDQIC